MGEDNKQLVKKKREVLTNTQQSSGRIYVAKKSIDKFLQFHNYSAAIDLCTKTVDLSFYIVN